MEIKRIFAILFSSALAASAEEPVQRVYDQVAATFELRDNRQPPTLKVKELSSASQFKGAFFDPDAREIVIDRRLLDHLIQEPLLGEDAIAFVLGHELGHFYGDHLLAAGAAGTANEEQRRRSLEEEADRKGVLHAHLAGYRGAAVAPEAIRALYGLYKLKPVSEGYPTLEARVNSTDTLVQRLRPLLPLYPLAMGLVAAQHLPEAALIVGYLADQFRSPDMVHNKAVLQAMTGLSKSSSLRYSGLYPFVLSTTSNLARSLGGARGGDTDPKPYLEAAELDFRVLLRQSPQDPALRINLSLVLDLSGRPKDGLTLLVKEDGFGPEMKPYRLAAQAILWHHSGQTARARQALDALKTTNKAAWDAFFRNIAPPANPSTTRDVACPDLYQIAQRAGYGSPALWSRTESIKGFGKVPGDSYNLSVEAGETKTALVARVRSHQVSLRIVVPKQLSELEQRALSTYATQNIPSLDLTGSPLSYLLYNNASCQFLLGARDRIVKDLAFLEYRW